MTQELWTAVDDHVNALLLPADQALDAALRASAEAGLPPINVTPSQGRLLQMLARTLDARAILEIGTLGGYSTIWLARAVRPGGRVVTLEVDAGHAKVARENIGRAGLDDVVDLRLGRALDLLPALAGESDPFDLVFVDADKESCSEYFDWALQLSRPGSLIVVDNVVRQGALADASSQDSRVQGVRRLIERLAVEPRVTATVLQTVGSKGYDGFAIARVS